MDETGKHTIKFDKSQLEALATITHAILSDKLVLLDDLTHKQERGLLEARNLIQKSLDFPDLKF